MSKHRPWADTNEDEIFFEEQLRKKGKTLIAQPYLKELHLRPDFYCPEEDTYYEVIGTRQAWFAKKDKIEKARNQGLKIITVDKYGIPYPYEKNRTAHPDNKKEYSLKISSLVLREARKKGIDCHLSLREIMEKLLNLWIDGKIKI